jgi:hypothetical protein
VQPASDGAARRLLEVARVTCRQHDDAFGAQLDGDPDRRVTGDRTVDEKALPDTNRRKRRGNRRAREDGLHGIAAGQRDRAAVKQVGRDHVHRNRRVPSSL